MIGPVTVETKVAAPAIATAVVSTLGAAVYALILAFGWLHPTAVQTAALAGMGAAVVYLVQVAVGYLSPHTHRADLISNPVVSAEVPVTPQPNKANPAVSSVQVIAPSAEPPAAAPAAPAPTVAP